MRLHRALAPLLALILTACGPGAGGGGVDVGLVYDAGGRGDKSFNDSAYLGLTRAKKELSLKVKDIEPSAQTSKEQALRALAQGKTPLILGIGILFSAEITKLAEEFPDIKFVCIDYVAPAEYAEGKKPLPANLLGVRFREQEGTYLIGAIAAKLSKTGKLGFVGGMEIPLIKRFEAGYRAGARAVNPKAEVFADYAGNDAEAWKNPTKGKELALAQFGKGVDIIFHASGSTGLGVFVAAKEKGKLAIGVDADQSAEAPDHIATSMIKRVDEAVFRAIRDFKQGKFTGGIQTLGLAENGLGYVASDQNARWLTPELIKEIDALKAKIVSGELTVPDK